MKQNMGTIDRVVRMLVAVAIAVLYLTDTISGRTALILGVVAAVFIVTSIFARCPAYLPFGLSTCKRPGASAG